MTGGRVMRKKRKPPEEENPHQAFKERGKP
jgi:hypothetical protein